MGDGPITLSLQLKLCWVELGCDNFSFVQPVVLSRLLKTKNALSLRVENLLQNNIIEVQLRQAQILLTPV